MSGNLCIFKGCGNSKKKYPHLHFFTFTNREERRNDQWIINSGNLALLDLPKEHLHRKCVCELHFEGNCFMNAKTRNKLTRFAIPTIFSPVKENHQPLPEPEPPLTRQYDSSLSKKQRRMYIRPESLESSKYYSSAVILENGFGCPTLLLNSHLLGNSNGAPSSGDDTAELDLPDCQISGRIPQSTGTTIRKYSSRLPNTLDEVEQYCMFIASELRRLPEEKRYRVQTKIQELLNDELIHD